MKPEKREMRSYKGFQDNFKTALKDRWMGSGDREGIFSESLGPSPGPKAIAFGTCWGCLQPHTMLFPLAKNMFFSCMAPPPLFPNREFDRDSYALKNGSKAFNA